MFPYRNLWPRNNKKTLGGDGMVTGDLTMGMIYLAQTTAGILGNFSLLSHYLYLYFTGCKFRPTDLIIKHLTVANCLVILSRGVPQTMAALGMKHFLSDIGCKLVFYVHRVSRDVCICSTCLLSISQAITISPKNTRWAELKAKAPKYIGPCNILMSLTGLRHNNQTLGDDGMATRDLTMGMIFLSQTLTGILGNFSLLSHYLYLYLTGCKFRSTDLIIKHLTVANCLVILSRGVPQTMAAFGMKHFLSDIGCKIVFYVHRVSRDVSTGTTCLLSTSQPITINPKNTRWAELKAKSPKYIGPCNILCWMLNLILNATVPVYVTGKSNDNNTTKKTDYGYCHSVNPGKFTESLYVALIFLQNILFVGLMLWASSFMIFTLHRHKQQVQYIHRTNITSRSSPESRATHSILVLVSTFVSLSTLSSIFHSCLTVLNNPNVWLVNTSALVAGSFPAVSPYILMRLDSRVPRLCCAHTRNTESPR